MQRKVCKRAYLITYLITRQGTMNIECICMCYRCKLGIGMMSTMEMCNNLCY